MKYLLLAISFLITSLSFAQKGSIDLQDNDNFEGFELYKDSLANYTVFINGENHSYTKSNAALQLKMLKYLHQNAGVKTLLLELGWSRGYIITKYIQTGDTTLLPSIKGYSWKYYADLVESLRKYNDSLAIGEKISVVGIDVERFNNMAIKALQLQLPNDKSKKPYDSIAVSIESIDALNTYLETATEWNEEKQEYVYETKYRGPSVNRSIEFILENIDKYKSHYLAYIAPENHEVFLKVVKQLKDKQTYEDFDYANSVQAYVYRERYMYDQFMDLYRKDTTQKYFMQFGRCHSVKSYQKEACTWHHYYSIASRINESEIANLKGKVLSTAIYYPKSDAWGNFDDSLRKHIEEVYLDSSYNDSLTLWNVKLDTSFADKHDFIIINKKELKTDKDPKASSSWDDFDFVDEANTLLVLKFGQTFANYSGLNTYLNARGYPDFNRKGAWGLDLAYLSNGGIYLGLGFTSPFSKKLIGNSGDTLKLNPSTWHLDFGYDLLNPKKINLIPFAGIGVDKLNFKETYFTSGGIAGSSFTSKASAVTLIGRVGAKIQANLNDFIIGAEYSFAQHLGQTKWTDEKNTLNNSIKLNKSAHLWFGYFGFMF